MNLIIEPSDKRTRFGPNTTRQNNSSPGDILRRGCNAVLNELEMARERLSMVARIPLVPRSRDHRLYTARTRRLLPNKQLIATDQPQSDVHHDGM